MPHFPRPFYKKRRQTWYVEINRNQINLGADKDEAFRLYHELMASRDEETPPTSGSVAALIDQFLDWCQNTASGYY